ncbi:MAG TPA: PP2C family protein-serine/threonine phosphatase [Terriglobales bacterium]
MLNLPFLKKPVPEDLKKPEPTCFPIMQAAEIAVRYHGARVGGDFFDMMTVGDRLIFVMLDIAGRREYAFHIAATVQVVFRERAAELFAEEPVNEADAITQLVLAMNRAIMEISGTAHFSTAFAGCYQQIVGTLCYINAGYTPALVRDSHGISELPANGLPLGLFMHATQDAQLTVLEPGAALLLFSRGLMEARNRRVEFGIERVRKVLGASSAQNAEVLCTELLESVLSHMHGHRIENDLSALALMRQATKAIAHV